LPADYTIDQERKLVVSRLWGTLTEDDVSGHNARLRADPRFNPGYQQLADLREITETKVGSRVVRDTARDQYFTPGVKRAFVADTDFVFALARMFASVAQTNGQVIEVFRDITDAQKWLGVTGTAIS
jgi:hypothetical protein